MLDQVEECENEYPHKVYKVPVKTNFFHHLVMSAFMVNTINRVDEDHYKKYNTWKYVRTVETCDKEEQVSKQWRAVLVLHQVSAEEFSTIGQGHTSLRAMNKVSPLPGLAANKAGTK